SDEAEALYQLNAHNNQLLIQYLGKRGLQSNPAGVEAVGADPMGLDIREGDNLRRVHAHQPCESVDDFLQMIEAG
ncbi:MAG: hypothetical protein N0E54_02785, partial [Candidatus Thiodiazotropha taylori]|nr:hypothetical protein [Candidatus Thiodiazotropha endolucinida]MCW4227651.1 hypothetical protein [Candidatus Thiodiazotropha taylori]